MRLNDSSVPQTTLYPMAQLKEITDSQDLTPKYAQILGQSDEFKEFLAVDLKENSNANCSEKNKRKFVCIVLHDDKIKIENYSNKGLAKALESNKNKVTYLALYVKNSEKDKLANEIKIKLTNLAGLDNQKKIDMIKEHLETIWSCMSFADYPSIFKFYDQQTGEPIEKEKLKLFEILQALKKRYEEIKLQCSESPRILDILKELNSILTRIENSYKDFTNNFQHLSTDTVAPVFEVFKNLKEKFEEKYKQLGIEKSNDEQNEKLKLLVNDISRLQDNCNKLTLERKYTEEIFVEKNEIIEQVKVLFENSVALINRNLTKEELIGLRTKLDSSKIRFDSLKDKLACEEISVSKQDEWTILNKMLKYYEKNFQTMLKDIENYLEKTSQEKAKVLKEIVGMLNDLKEKIIAKAGIKEINMITTEIKGFIQTKYKGLDVPRGYFLWHGRSADLIKDLPLKLDELVAQIDDNGKERNLSIRP